MWRFDPSERKFLRETDEALMNAPFVEGGWMTALDMIARATSSRGANLVCLGGALPSLNLISGFDQDLVDRYFANPEMWGRHNWRVGTATGPFEIQHDAHYRAYREAIGSGDYCDAANELDMPFGCQTIFSHDESGFVGMAIMRGRRDGAADPEMVRRFDYLSRRIARALRAEMALAGEGVRSRLGTIDESREAMVLVNRHGWVVGMSDCAETLLDAALPLRIRGARLAAAGPQDDFRLQQLLQWVLHPDHRSPAGAIALTLRESAPQAWRLHLVVVPEGRDSLGFDARIVLRLEPLGTRGRGGLLA